MKQSSCDGLAEEINESALLLGKNRGGGIRARRKTGGGLRSLVSSVVAWRAARGTIYRQGEAVEGRTRWPASTAVLC